MVNYYINILANVGQAGLSEFAFSWECCFLVFADVECIRDNEGLIWSQRAACTSLIHSMTAVLSGY